MMHLYRIAPGPEIARNHTPGPQKSQAAGWASGGDQIVVFARHNPGQGC